jgi:hypothetical protein
MTTDAELREFFPEIEWDEPAMISLVGEEEQHFGCRLCVGRFGLKGQDVGQLPTTREEWQKHQDEFHGST